MTATAHYGCRANSVTRATGQSVVAASAYRSALRMEDARTGLTHDYRAKGGVLLSELVLPAGAPAWAHDRAALWNAAEVAEDKSTRRAVAKTGRDFIIDLPHEVSPEGRAMAARQFAQYLCDTYGVAVDFAVHAPDTHGDQRNYHAHVLTSTRRLTDAGFAGKVRELDSPLTSGQHMEAIRAKWAEIQNAAYQREGLDIRADHRSYEAQGINKEGTKHLGPMASAMERKGEASDRGDVNRQIRARNAEREQMEAKRLSLTEAITALQAEREARADQRELRAAVRSESSGRILEALTERRATFTRGELVKLLGGVVEDRADAGGLATELLAHPEVIGLKETADAAVSRYTTREVLAAERQILKDGRAMAASDRAGLSERQLNAVMSNHKRLDEEQRDALRQLTGRGRIGLLVGEAGTGKSTTINAARDAYEKAGYRVVGTSWTHSVIQDMKADGFKETTTLAGIFGRAERAASRNDWRTKRNGTATRNIRQGDSEGWNSKTVIIVDEAALISTQNLGRLMAKADAAGAKIIAAFDDKQLSSIERGGILGALKDQLGAAELHKIWRVGDDNQKRAFNAMHEGRFAEALSIFDKAGAINWTEAQDEARTALVAKWAADTKASPEKSRFVFAYTNVDVLALNADLRAIRRERGELGADHLMRTRDGAVNFAEGDRIQFTGSAYHSDGKAAGLTTSAIGTVRAIVGQRMTVQLDGKDDKPGKVVSFTVGDDEKGGQFDAIRHGYAGTIYKGQGRTLDQSYLYHSANWRAASAYVALSRHRESTSLFVAREVTRGREPWMMQQGGLDGLDEKQRQRADNAYHAWAEENPAAAEKFGLARYVAYVQGKQAERGRSEYDMAQLARQISRIDETRAATQFISTDLPPAKATGGGGASRPRLSGPNRYAALKAEAKVIFQRVTDPIADLIKRGGRAAENRAGNKYDDLRKQGEAVPAKPAPSGEPGGLMSDFVDPSAKLEAEKRQREENARNTGKSRPKGYDL